MEEFIKEEYNLTLTQIKDYIKPHIEKYQLNERSIIRINHQYLLDTDQLIIAQQVLDELVRQSKNQISLPDVLIQVLKRNGIDTNDDCIVTKSVFSANDLVLTR